MLCGILVKLIFFIAAVVSICGCCCNNSDDVEVLQNCTVVTVQGFSNILLWNPVQCAIWKCTLHNACLVFYEHNLFKRFFT